MSAPTVTPSAASAASHPEGRAGEVRVPRFGATERTLHLIHATGFTAMAATGFGLGLPCLGHAYGLEHRPLVLAAHLTIATIWLTLAAILIVFGDARSLRRTAEQFESLDGADLRWLRSKAARAEPQARFNGGQKLHGIVQATASLLLLASGAILWVGLSRPSLVPPGTLGLHDFTMALAMAFIAGHIAVAVSPSIRPSIAGMVRGTVPQSYATTHHAAWDPAAEPASRRAQVTFTRVATATCILAIGVSTIALIFGP